MSKPSIEDRAQALFRAAGPSDALSPEALEAVWQKTEPKLTRRPLVHLPKVLLVGALLVGAWWLFEPQQQPPQPAQIEPVAAVPAMPVPSQPEPMVPLETPPPAPQPLRKKPVTPPAAPVQVEEREEAEDPLLAESKLLARAVTQLRDEHDAVGALATLDDHARRFSKGLLVREVQLARVETLVAAGQRAGALSLLESMDLASAPRGEELRVLEGELLAESGRCEEAVVQFDKALGASLVKEARERALRGKARCGP